MRYGTSPSGFGSALLAESPLRADCLGFVVEGSVRA